jgi:hypothetical protein
MTHVVPVAAVLLVALSAGCAGKESDNRTPVFLGGTPTSSANPTGGATPTAVPPSPKPSTNTTSKPPSQPSWPVPEDCVSYNPNNLTVNYEAGTYQISDGAKVVARIAGGPGENLGEKGLALAQRYTRHCFIGRNNNRSEYHTFVFDYWRSPSGATPTIADQEEDCSSYNRNNLTVEDMGNGDGWRVKDHDHVLQLFDSGDDARAGKLVLSKYSTICYLGYGDENFEQITYSM